MKPKITKKPYRNPDTIGDAVFSQFTAMLLPGDEHLPGRERKGRPPRPEWYNDLMEKNRKTIKASAS